MSEPTPLSKDLLECVSRPILDAINAADELTQEMRRLRKPFNPTYTQTVHTTHHLLRLRNVLEKEWCIATGRAKQDSPYKIGGNDE